MAFQEIVFEVAGPVATILHNRPHTRNAENKSLLEEMDQALQAAVADDNVRVIIIGGTGDHFSSGHDVIEAQRDRPNLTVEQRWVHEHRYYFDYAMRIWDCPKPTIARVQGACIAGAFMVANMCDMIVASEDAYFTDPVCHSMAAASVEMLVHPWVMGTRTAKEFLFTGRKVGAAEAQQWGMVNKVVPRAELDAQTLALAQHIAKAQPFALRLVKRSLNRALDMQGFRTALQAHFDTHQLSHVSESFMEAKREGRRKTIDMNRELKI